jgi:hypothetical protein
MAQYSLAFASCASGATGHLVYENGEGSNRIGGRDDADAGPCAR